MAEELAQPQSAHAPGATSRRVLPFAAGAAGLAAFSWISHNPIAEAPARTPKTEKEKF